MLLGRGDLTTALRSVARITSCDQRAGGVRQEAGKSARPTTVTWRWFPSLVVGRVRSTAFCRRTLVASSGDASMYCSNQDIEWQTATKKLVRTAGLSHRPSQARAERNLQRGVSEPNPNRHVRLRCDALTDSNQAPPLPLLPPVPAPPPVPALPLVPPVPAPAALPAVPPAPPPPALPAIPPVPAPPVVPPAEIPPAPLLALPPAPLPALPPAPAAPPLPLVPPFAPPPLPLVPPLVPPIPAAPPLPPVAPPMPRPPVPAAAPPVPAPAPPAVPAPAPPLSSWHFQAPAVQLQLPLAVGQTVPAGTVHDWFATGVCWLHTVASGTAIEPPLAPLPAAPAAAALPPEPAPAPPVRAESSSVLPQATAKADQSANSAKKPGVRSRRGIGIGFSTQSARQFGTKHRCSLRHADAARLATEQQLNRIVLALHARSTCPRRARPDCRRCASPRCSPRRRRVVRAACPTR